MAKNKRGRSYKLTPRRKAALSKAQAASARKRRRRGAVAGGVVAATLVGGAVAYGASRRRSSKSSVPGNAVVLVPGKGRTYTTIGPRKRERNVANTHTFGPKVLRVSSDGLISKTRFKAFRTPAEQRKTDRKRMQYWAGKPVGGAPRKPYTSNKRGRR